MEREDKQEKYEVEKRKTVNYKIQINDEGRKLKVYNTQMVAVALGPWASHSEDRAEP